MSFVKNLFGKDLKSSSTTTQQRLPFRISTGAGSQLRSTGGLDPQITSQISPQVGDLRGEFTSGIRSLLGSARGELVDARVNPLIRRLSGLPGQQRRSLAQRNVFGSIPENLVAATERDVAQTIGEARTLATQDAITQEANLLQGLRAAGQDQLAQELSLLGLSNQAIAAISQSQTTRKDPNLGQGIGNLLFGLGSILPGPRCYLAALIYGAMSEEHTTIAMYVNDPNVDTPKVKEIREIYKKLMPKFEALLMEANNAR